MADARVNAGPFGLAVKKPLLLAAFGTSISELPAFVGCFASGSSLHQDLRGLSLPSSPSFTPNAPAVLCGGKSEPNLNIPLNASLNSSLSSNYHATFSSSTGWSTFHVAPSHYHAETHNGRKPAVTLSNDVCVFLSSPQVQPRALPSPATPSPPPSRPARPRGVTSAPSAMRMWWTRSFMPVDTCVSATPAALSSRKWPTPAAPSVGGQSKTSSRSTGARRFCVCRRVTLGLSAAEVAKAMNLFNRNLCLCVWLRYSRTPITKTLYLRCFGGDLWKKPKASSPFLKGNKFL